MSKVRVWNHNTKQEELVDSSKVADLVATGRYEALPEVSSKGITRSSGDVAALERVGEVADPVATVDRYTGQLEKESEDLRNEEVTGGLNRVLAFADGVVDSLSFGLMDVRRATQFAGFGAAVDFIDTAADANNQISPYSTEAIERRGQVYGGTRMGGQIAGVIIGLGTPGPIQALRHLGKHGGKALSKMIWGAQKAEGAIMTRVLEEAGEGAALSFAHGLGTELGNVMFEDKPFVAEAVLNETGVGTLLGGGVGFLGGAAAKVVRRAKQADAVFQNGLLDAESAVSKEVHQSVRDAIKAMEEGLDEHRFKLGILEDLAERGHVNKAWLDQTKKSLREAEKAFNKMDVDGLERAIKRGVIDDNYVKLRDSMENFQGRLVELDDTVYKNLQAEMLARNKQVLGQADDAFRARTGADMKGKVAPDYPGYPEGVPAGTDAIHPGIMSKLDPSGNPATADVYQLQYRKMMGEVPDFAEPHPSLGREVSGEMVAREISSPPVDAGPSVVDDSMFRRDSSVLPRQMMGLADPFTTPPVPGRTGVMGAQDAADLRALSGAKPFGKAADEVAAPPPRVPTEEMGAVDDAAGPDVFTKAGSKRAQKLRNEPRQAPPKDVPDVKAQGKKAVDDYLNDVYKKVSARGPRPSPADISAGKIADLMDKINVLSRGKLDSSSMVDVFSAMGYKKASTSFGGQLDQLMAVRQLGRAVAGGSGKDAIKGAARENMLRWLGRHLGYVGGRKMAGGVAGYALAGPLGAILGAKFVDNVLGFTGKAASSAGRLNLKVAKVVDRLLNKSLIGKEGGKHTVGHEVYHPDPSPTGATLMRETIKARHSKNQAHSYSGGKPIEDPMERIQEIHRLAQNTYAIEALVRDGFGDNAVIHEDLVREVARQTQQRMVQLSMKAPKFMWDRLGNPIPPPAQAMRRFFLYENATNDLEGTLEAVATGQATEEHYEALRTNHQGVTRALVSEVIKRSGDLKNADRATLKVVERLTGMPLTKASDPAFLARQAQAWRTHEAMNQAPQIKKGSLTPPTSTPAQSTVAPGNQ